MTVLDAEFDIRTARLQLRPPREDDVAPLAALFDNWEVMRWLSSPPWPYRRDDAQDFVDRRKSASADCITAAIVLGNAFIGAVDVIVKPASAMQRERGLSLGYWIGQPYWGKGYMSEAARGFITHVFAQIADDTIYSGAFAGNAASLRIQEKLGFTRDSKGMFFSNPNRRDVLHVNTSLTRARFAALSQISL